MLTMQARRDRVPSESAVAAVVALSQATDSDADTIERPGATGRPLPLTEIKIVDRVGSTDGEIFIPPPTQMAGYYGSTTSSLDDEGWLSTSDLGRVDGGGLVWTGQVDKPGVVADAGLAQETVQVDSEPIRRLAPGPRIFHGEEEVDRAAGGSLVR